jgi:D-alanyl-D-alanine carboxypeptidase
MSRHFVRIVIFLLLAAGVGGLIASAAPLQLAQAVQPTSVPSALTALAPMETEHALVRLHLIPTGSPSPTPTPKPTPSPSPKPVLGRPLQAVPPITPPTIDAAEIALVNLDTGRFIWQSNTQQPWAPASLTKIFTAMVAVDLMGYNRIVTVPASIISLPADSTVMGLTPGEQLSVRDLLYGIFLRSGNDAAETLAVAVTSRSQFVADMNAKAARLGLHTSHFMNPTGLDEPGHYSSAYDLAIASMYLEYHYAGLVNIAATPAITIPATATHKVYNLVSIDKLLFTYPGTYGLKTGWTDNALGCLITTVSRGGHRLLAVMLGAPANTAYPQMPKILDYGFQLLGVLPRS